MSFLKEPYVNQTFQEIIPNANFINCYVNKTGNYRV